VTPDIENLQVVGFGQGESPEAAVRNMVEESKNCAGSEGAGHHGEHGLPILYLRCRIDITY
jgi:hypothetical protein